MMWFVVVDDGGVWFECFYESMCEAFGCVRETWNHSAMDLKVFIWHFCVELCTYPFESI